MGDRQDLRLNMAKMTEQDMQSVIEAHLRKLNLELKIGLSEEELIRTRVYRVAKSESFVNSFGSAAKVTRNIETFEVAPPPC